MEQPDTITIEVTDTDELLADQVDLFVTIEGKSLFTLKLTVQYRVSPLEREA